MLTHILVPILPDYLTQLDNEVKSYDKPIQHGNQYIPNVFSVFSDIVSKGNQSIGDGVAKDPLWDRIKLNDENSSVGILLATKALVQLIATPFVKSLINSFGYSVTITLGTFVLFLASFGLYFF